MTTRRQSRVSFANAPSLTKQAFREPSRVDSLLKKYAALGVTPADASWNANLTQPHGYMGPETFDYQTQLNKVIRVQENFKRLPSALRDRFNHDPATLLGWLADPKNVAEATKLGLLRTDKPETAPAAPKTPTADTPAKA